MNTLSVLRAITLGAICLVPLSASAQYKLGDGTKLDRNLNVLEGPRNQAAVSELGRQLQFQNAIVTGNAPGGLSLQAPVGYTAPFEFRGHLPSDDLFTYRRDSLYSGLAGVGIRGTESIQYQFSLTTGTQPPTGLIGPFTYERGQARAAGDPAPGTTRFDPAAFDYQERRVLHHKDPNDPTIPRGGTMLEAQRSTAAYVAGQTYQPALLTTLSSPDGTPMGLVASSLRGVAYEPFVPVPGAPSIPAPGTPLPTEPAPAPSGDSRLATAAPSTQLSGVSPAAESLRASNPYDAIAARIAEQAPPAEGAAEGEPVSPWQQPILDLQRQLITPTAPAEPGEGEPAPEDADAAIDPRAIEIIRIAGAERIETLVAPAPPGTRDLYAEHMLRAQDLLAEGRFFDAEARFTAALSMRPRDPMANVGRIHAQLGAGMFLSAAVNLSSLIVEHPELVAVRYGPDLLPSGADGQRLNNVAMLLRQNLSPDSQLRRESALLLAYLGYQTGDAQMVDEGLRALDGPHGADPLIDLLRNVWRAQ